MRLANAVFLAVGVLLVCWGAADFRSWATTGQELLTHYAESEAVQELVRQTFCGGIIKVILGFLTAGVSLVLVRRNKVNT